MKACKLFTEACTNKQGSLTSKTVQPTPAQIGSAYSAALMHILHESLACVCECYYHKEVEWETCGYTTAKEGDGVSLGRPLGTMKEAGYGVNRGDL